MPKEKPSILSKITSGKTSELLSLLKSKLIPTKSALKNSKESISSTAATFLKMIESFDPFKNKLFDKAKNKGKITMTSIIGFLAWTLKPEVSEEKTEKEEVKSTDKTDNEIIKQPDNMKFVFATISPNASPEKVILAMETNAKNLDELYKGYKKTKDPKKLRYFIWKAIAAKESGRGVSRRRLRLINQFAISPGKRQKLLKEKGITVPPASRKQLLPNESYLSSYAVFKARACSVLQPNLSDGDRRTSNTAEILARCAVGKYQVLPIYWVNGVKNKKNMGEAELMTIYNYIKSPIQQQKTSLGIIDSLGKKYNWNPAHIMLAYYAGSKWVDVFKKNPNHPALHHGEYGGHGSKMAYIKRTTALANKFIRSDQKSA